MSKKPTTHEFQAETKQVLDIVVNSLYKDKEIFVRELISNASDALEKLRMLQLTEKDVFDDNLGLEINVTTDDSGNQLTIQDFGIGMTKDELVKNLGTIAHSGSKEFMEALKSDGEKNRHTPEHGKPRATDNVGRAVGTGPTRSNLPMAKGEARKSSSSSRTTFPSLPRRIA
jgi:hypothetical protein